MTFLRVVNYRQGVLALSLHGSAKADGERR